MGQLPFEKIERRILVKREAATSLNHGCRPEERKTEELIAYGIVNINKPSGPTSHQVSEYVQKILKIDKAGHSGTLDPAVTGVLPVALGRGTRIVQALLNAGKEYVGVMHLHKEVSKEELQKIINEKFLGKIRQLPPIKSAVKREERTREIYYFEILEIEEKDVLFRVGCEAGTYIRKLCHDIGQSLKVGAHMSELRRTKAGPFDESSMATLQDLKDAFHYFFNEKNDQFLRKTIQPVENGVRHFPKVWVLDGAIKSLCHGVDLKMPGIAKLHSGIKKGNLAAVMSLKDELIGLGTAIESSEQMMKKSGGIAVKIEKVFMEPNVYKLASP